MLTLIICFGDCALVTAPLTALLDRLNSPFHVVQIVLKILKIRKDIYSSFFLTFTPVIIKLKCVHVIKKVNFLYPEGKNKCFVVIPFEPTNTPVFYTTMIKVL